MMSRSHLATGIIFGCVVATAIHNGPLLVRALVIPVAGGSALLPDIDSRSSRVTVSLGVVTKILSRICAHVAEAIYDATRTEHDKTGSNGGHRRYFHTIPGCATFAGLAWGATVAHPLAAAAVLSLLCGLTAQVYKSIGVGFTVAASVTAWLVVTQYPAWSWLWPCVVGVGAWVHCLGDTITAKGTPMLWPLCRDGKRWEPVTFPPGFTTNSETEREAVTPLLVCLIVVGFGFASGVAQLLIGVWLR